MKLILTLFTCLFVTGCAYAQNFSDYFTNKTLRIDYLFTGNADKQSICLDELSELPGMGRQAPSSVGIAFGRKRTDCNAQMWQVEK